MLAANQAMTEAGNNRDLDALFEFVLDGADPIVQDGVLFATKQEARQVVEQGFQGVSRVERSFDHTTVMVLSTAAAMLTASGETKVALDDGRAFSGPFAVTLLFVRQGQEWRVRHGHYSVQLPPNSAIVSARRSPKESCSSNSWLMSPATSSR